MAAYRTSPPSEARVIAMPKVPPRPEIPRGDRHQVTEFKTAIRDAMRQVTEVAVTSAEAEFALDTASAFTVQMVRSINTAHGRNRGGKRKDGYSPEYVLRKFHLCAVIEIRRHLTGQHGKKRWPDFVSARSGMQYIFRVLTSRGESMGISQKEITKILSVDMASPDYFMSLPSSPSPQACDEAIRVLRHKLQGRMRTDMRLAHKGFMSYIEANREKGRLKPIVKAVLGSHAGRKHQDGLQMDSVTTDSGKVIGDPAAVHSMWTKHFQSVYAIPKQFDNELHRTEDWEPIIEDRQRFMDIHKDSNIPQWCLDNIFESLQVKPQAKQVHDELTISLASPPTIEEFYKNIRCSKTNSAPGPSGLSYNMLKSMPKEMVEQIHTWLVMLWRDRTKIASWGWRWLHLISKTISTHIGLNDCRPIMLCEALRKIWGKAILSKVTVALHHAQVLEDVQHGFIGGKGTDTASILHINHMEDVQERTGTSHQTSFDLQRAFDSVSISSQYWGLRRVGVPKTMALDMATSDVGGTTVVRSPFAEFLWSQLPYACVKTDGNTPVGWFAATPDSMIVESFCPERGTGQGLIDSPTKWTINFDIIATGLRLLDSQENTPTLVGGEDNAVYEHKCILYADDHKASSTLSAMIQKKAELVSAFCIVLGLELSQKKIRRVVQEFVHQRYREKVQFTTVYSAGWVAHEVRVQDTGSTEFLGGIYDTDNSGAGTLAWLTTKAEIAAQCVRSRKGFSAAARLGVLNMSVLSSMVYKTANSILSHAELESIDSIIDSVLVNTTKNMYSFPRKLLHIDRQLGGHGLPSFSHEAEARKLQRLFSCLRSQQRHGLAARGILSRAARQNGYFVSTGQSLCIVPGSPARTTQKTYCDGPITYLSRYDLFLCRHGKSLSVADPGYHLVNLISHDNTTLRRYCFSNGFYTLGDITRVQNGTLAWYLPEVLAELTSVLPTVPADAPLALLVGQYWQPMSAQKGQVFSSNDILRIDGRLENCVLVTRFAKLRASQRYRMIPGQCRVPYDSLFHRPLVTRCNISLQSDGTYMRNHIRFQPSPHWQVYDDPIMPDWAPFVLDMLSRLDSSYVARPYTDGSHTPQPSVKNYFRHEERHAIATCSVIIKDDTPDWKSKPVIAVHIDRGDEIGADAAFTMEFLALAASLQVTVLSEGRLHATGSDAQSVLDLLPGRRQRLQQVMKDHHFLLQCIDNSLYRGVPMPYKVPSHAEKHKPQKDSQGRLGVNWTNDEWGNWIADRVADNDVEALQRQGIRYVLQTVPAKKVYDQLLFSGQWFIGGRTGSPVPPKGVNAIIQATLHRQYLQERDAFREARGESPVWQLDSSMAHAALMYGLRKAPSNSASTIIRLIYDKGYHGGNRAKNKSLSTSDREQTRKCCLCQMPESQNHWLHECNHGPLRTLRASVFADLNRHLLVYREKSSLHRQLGTGFKHILMSTSEPARIWTGNWSLQQIQLLSSLIDPELLATLQPNTLASIVLPLEKILAEGALNLWQCKVMQERKLPVSVKSRPNSNVKQSDGVLRISPTDNVATPTALVKRSRLRIDVAQSSGTHLRPTLGFPELSAKVLRDIEVANRADRSTKTVLRLDEYHLYGSYFRRLAGLCDGGHLHVHSIKGFLYVLQTTMKIHIHFLREDDGISLLQDESFTLRPAFLERLAGLARTSQWIILLLPNKASSNDIFEAALCYDVTNRILHYLHENTVTEAVYREHMRIARKIGEIYEISHTSLQAHKGGHVNEADSGIWLCLAIQLLLQGYDMPSWTTSMAAEGRTYVASCLLQRRCSAAQELLLMATTTTLNHDSEIATSVTLKDYHPGEDELGGDFPSYNMLHPLYVYRPCTNIEDLQSISRGTDITYHQLSEPDKDVLRQWCRAMPTMDFVYSNGMRGVVQAIDIMQLLSPTTLSIGLLMHLLFAQFPDEHPSVTVVDEGVMASIYKREWDKDSMDSNSLAHSGLCNLLDTMWLKEWIVFPFMTGSHFHGVLVRYSLQTTDNGNFLKGGIYHIDSFLSTDDKHAHLIQDFLQWSYGQSTPIITDGQWDINLQSTGAMVRQHMYLAPGQHDDLKLHIDCALYFYFIIIRLITGGTADGISPLGVHQSRPILAWHLAMRHVLPSVSYWFADEVSNRNTLVGQESLLDADNHNIEINILSTLAGDAIPISLSPEATSVSIQFMTHGKEAEIQPGLTDGTQGTDLLPICRTRPMFPRRAKSSSEPVLDAPKAPSRSWGTNAHDIGEDTYIADSTLSEPKLGIDAGFGLFASRSFGEHLTRKNDDFITYYEGTVLSLEELETILCDPTYTRTTAFIINFRGIIIDGYDHDRDTYACHGAIINDFLDERNNSYFSKDLPEDSSDDDDDDDEKPKKLRKATSSAALANVHSRRLAIRSDANQVVEMHQEFGISYGEQHFCKPTVHIAVLFKAARYYWTNIFSEPAIRDRWARLPQARYLFNSPYHGAHPQTTEDIVQRIITHLIRCTQSRCRCDLDGYINRRQFRPESMNVTAMLNTLSSSSKALSSRKRHLHGSDGQECIITKVVPRCQVPSSGSFKSPAAIGARYTSTGDTLCFHEETRDWTLLDSMCAEGHDVSHYINSSDPRRFSLLTEELQDLRSGMLGCEVVHRYFSILCASSVNRNVQHFTPVYTSLMAGLVTEGGVDPHTQFEDRHLFCEWLLCPFVHDLHISFVTICYNTCTMIHEDSKCGIHNSERIFLGIEKFLRDHITWRQERNLPQRSGLSITTTWTRIKASPTTTAQQGDGVSCGILTCGNATCRIHGMPGFPCGQAYVPQLRLHIYHCIMQDTFFPITISNLTDTVRERMSATGDWYERHKTGYSVILNNRRTRPRPKPTVLIGQGTAQEPFLVETAISRSAHRAKRLSDAILLPDNVDVISPESIDNNDILRGTQSQEMYQTRKRVTFLVPADKAEQRSLIADVSTTKARRPVFRAGDRSKRYAERCRRACSVQRTPPTETSLVLSLQSAEALSPESVGRDDTDFSPPPSDHILCIQPVSVDPSPSSQLSKKRGRDVHEVLHTATDSIQAQLPRDKKRKSTRKLNLGYARQKTTMDSFVSRLKAIPNTSMETAGGSAALGVVSNTSLVIHNPNDSVNDSVMTVAHVDLVGQIEHDYSSDATPSKRARMEQKVAHASASSTLLEYDKRIADS